MEKNLEPQVMIHTRNMQLTDAIETYVTKKTAKFIRHLPGIDEIRVDLDHVRTARNVADRNVAQITIHGKKFLLRAEERAEDLYAAIDATIDKMDRQIRRFKGKRYDKRAGETVSEGFADLNEPELEEEEAPVVARRKAFTIYPMNELEAIEQMKLLGHENFFVFYNAETSKINVLYKRRNGSYGIIDPEIG
ncbi:MAG: ribosome-associated translation inhibitor RaiA [Anaerolineae bacterium]|nr:ribosome-associated translation inhibitor RaiA [Anaerolineae bacterium]